MIAYIFFTVSTILYPIVQILHKKGMSEIGGIGSFSKAIMMIPKLISNPYIVGGVSLSLVSLVFWLSSLSNLKVSYLYPLGAGIQNIILFLMAIYILGETATMANWIGIVVITAGIVLLHY